ncbi:MAG: hypothetical protein ACRDQ0_04250, partial [Pseudonocardia sp.]
MAPGGTRSPSDERAVHPGAKDLAWDRAREGAFRSASVLPAVDLPLALAHGTVLAAALIAPTDLPPVPRSAMDGYAVRGPSPWVVVGPGAGLQHSHLPAT